MKEEWQREARATYGLAADALAEVDAALEEAAAGVDHQVGGGETARSARLPLISLLGALDYLVMLRYEHNGLHGIRRRWRARRLAENLMFLAEAPLDALSREQKLLLLKRLRAKLKALAATLAAKQGSGGAAAAPAVDASTGVGDAEAVNAHPLGLPRSLAVQGCPSLARHQCFEIGISHSCEVALC